MSYHRVIPRDLFNEAKLLKCIGRLALIIHDGMDDNRTAYPRGLRIEHDGEAFNIVQDEASGMLSCDTVRFFANETPLIISTAYNSKEAYPLYCDCDGEEVSVFDDSGNLTEEFVEFVSRQ